MRSIAMPGLLLTSVLLNACSDAVETSARSARPPTALPATLPATSPIVQPATRLASATAPTP